MLRRYHIEIIKETLGGFFTSNSLQEIWRANVGQDSIQSMFGYESRRHACDCDVADSLAYIEEEQALIVELCHVRGAEQRQRAAFGRLLHTVHDIYAHTTYVALWVAQSGCVAQSRLSGGVERRWVDGLDPAIIAHPSLQVARWDTWREPLYYLPLLGQLLRCFGVPAGSHEAINLDSPKRGANFDLAMAIARQRTRQEYDRTVVAIGEVGGRLAVARFHGLPEGVIEGVHPLAPDEWAGVATFSGAGSSLVIDTFE